MGQQNKAMQLQLIVGRQSSRTQPELDTWLREPPIAMFDALLNQADPRGQSRLDAAARAVRRLCGRWLTLARLRLGLSSGLLSEGANIDETILHRLECGLADERLVPAAAGEQLAALLAGAASDSTMASEVLAIAVGRALPSDGVLRMISAELVELDSDALDGEKNSYELFRRAIVERDADAWAEIHQRYRALLISWARRISATAQLNENLANLADSALARAWRALTPDQFSQFSNMASLMAYLRTCMRSTVIDAARAQAHANREQAQPDGLRDVQASAEQIVLNNLSYAAVWRAVCAIAESPAERTLLLECFVNGLPPREIHARYPELFANIATVYKVKRNLLERLQRAPELREHVGGVE